MSTVGLFSKRDWETQSERIPGLINIARIAILFSLLVIQIAGNYADSDTNGNTYNSTDTNGNTNSNAYDSTDADSDINGNAYDSTDSDTEPNGNTNGKTDSNTDYGTNRRTDT